MKTKERKIDQAKVKQRKHIAFRMNFLFFSIFVLFSLLIFRLGYLQIVNGDDYVRALEQKEEIAINTSVPRGRLFDRMGHILVDNEPKNAITYTKTSSTTSREMLKIAEELAELITQDTKRVTVGDKRDFWILKHPEEAAKKVSKEEQAAIKKDSSLTKAEAERKINRLVRERVTDEELNSFSDHDLEVLAIYREMMSGYAYSPQIIKSGDVTEEEFAAVSERLSDFEGVNTTTDWERVKKSDNTILGSTTSPIEGIPKTHLNYFLARDYSRNDRVGRSFLEQYYEDLLYGQKSIVKNIKDRTGQVVETKTIREGEPGRDLVLTIDSELQIALEDLLSRKLLQLKSSPYASLLDRGFIVMMDPNTGEVLSMVGKKVTKDSETGKRQIIDYAFGTYTSAHEMGSTVKMATLLTGYSEGVVRLGESKIDEPLFVGKTRKASLFNQSGRVSINDVQAIGRSSNVYMYKIAFSLGGAVYRPHQGMSIDVGAFDTFRNGFASFGLGVPTGIDLPGENAGYRNEEDVLTGKLMDFSTGQFDTYTTMQLAQYVSTIANGGYRVAPKLLKEIREPSEDGETFGPLLEQTDIRVLNRIANSDEEIERVKKGMHYVYYGPNGTAKNLLAGASYDAGGKTGTAQADYYGEDRSRYGTRTINLTHVGFAPFNEPEVAFAVVIPHLWTSQRGYPYVNNEIAKEALDIYFQLKQQRTQNGMHATTVEEILPPITANDDASE